MRKSIVIDISDSTGEGTLYNKIEKKAYKIGENEYEVWKMLNSEMGLDDIYQKCNFYTQSEIDELVGVLSRKNLLNDEHNNAKKSFKWNEVKFGLCYPDKMLENKGGIIEIISKISNAICFPCIILAIILTIQDFDDIKRIFIESNYIYIGVVSVVLMILSLAIHEIFHAIEAKRWGAKVPEFGIKCIMDFRLLIHPCVI